MKQITVRSIPEDLERELRNRAERDGTSLNQTVLRLLRQAAGLDRSRHGRKRDLSCVAGKWTARQAEEFSRNVEAFEDVDPGVWQ